VDRQLSEILQMDTNLLAEKIKMLLCPNFGGGEWGWAAGYH
jgi:hypothetical protein